MFEIVNKLLELMKPYVEKIEDKKVNLDEKESFLASVEAFMKYINDEPLKIFDYGKKELLEKLIDDIGSNVDEYKANEYILKADVSQVVHLPQYNNANEYLGRLYEYIKSVLEKNAYEYEELATEYENIELIKKYYDMFKDNDIFVTDEVEFSRMLGNFNLTWDEKIDLLVYVLKENNRKYHFAKEAEPIEENLEERFEKIINDNKKLLTNQYNELLEVVSEYVDLTKNIRDIVNYELINKININNILLAKKIWLMKKIEFSYNNAQYNKGKLFVEEFEEVADLLDEIRNIKDKKEAVRIIKGENEDER